MFFASKGEPLRDVTYPVHAVSQATALCWHPERRQLIAGWENGELNSWSAGNRTFSSIGGTHKSPIVYVGFSEQGGRMVTADSVNFIEAKIQRENKTLILNTDGNINGLAL